MLDLRMIRERPEEVQAALARRHDGTAAIIPEIVRLDERRRELVARADTLRGERNAVSKQISRLKDAAERQREVELLRSDHERLDELQQRQLRYASYAWQPPAQGGDIRAEDGDPPSS